MAPVSSLSRLWRRVPIELIAFVVIAVGILWTHVSYVRQGMCFNDPGWYFHFGQRLLDGDVPYRDYVFQVGPLPIYVDAGFQAALGEQYTSSLYAALAITILRVFVAWLIAYRLAGRVAASLLAVFCAFDPMFAFVWHWSTPYAHLFFLLAGLFLVVASRADGRKALVYLALAGLSAGMVAWARQSAGLMIGIVGFAATSIMWLRREYFTRARFIALWAGFALGFVLLFVFLAAQGALGSAIQQLFLDAPQKKGLHGIDLLLDPMTGGALQHHRFDPTYTWWGGLLAFLGLPIGIVCAIVYLSSRERTVSLGTLALLLAPVILAFGLVTRYAPLNYVADLPRTFFMVTTALSVLYPARFRAWFGLEPLAAVGLGAFPLASDWALELSNEGRGWGDPLSLVVALVLFSIASRRLEQRAKTWLCAAFALAGVIHVGATLGDDLNPFGIDGKVTETVHKVRHPMMRGLRVNEGRKLAVDLLRQEVEPGATCFVYGNLPVLYSLTGCKNPTLIDSTAADFMTVQDAQRAIDALVASPPDYLLAHEKSWMNPKLTEDRRGVLAAYDGLNPRVSKVLHEGLRSILDQYDVVAFTADFIGPELSQITAGKWDAIDQLRIYRRKRRGN